MSASRILQLGVKDENMAIVHVAPYVFLLLAPVVMLLTPHLSDIPLDTPVIPPVRGEYFSGGYTSTSYWVWMTMSLACPVLVMASYWIPSRVGDSRYACIWLRAAGDAGQIFTLLALEVSTVKLANAEVVYRQALFFGFVVFCVVMLLRDVYLIVATERLAVRINRDDSGKD